MENRIGDLSIERGETGYIVYEHTGRGILGKKWAFESTDSLAEFVAGWADNDKDVVGA
jgi:hypothetical protein